MEQLVTQIIRNTEQQMRISNDFRKKRIWSQMTVENKVQYAVNLIKRKGMKDWRLIPPEIKREYIKLLDFPDRLRLRMTAAAERALVDSLPVKFSSIELVNLKRNEDIGFQRNYGRFNRRHGRFRTSEPTQGWLTASFPVLNSPQNKSKELNIFNEKMYSSAMHFLAYLLKIEKIDKLQIKETYSPKRFDNFMKVLEKSAPYHIKNFSIVAKRPAVESFLKNIDLKSLESIELNAEGSHEFPFDDFLKIQSFIETPLLKIKSLEVPEDVPKLVEKWIENDSKVGTEFRTSVNTRGPEVVEKFIDKFVERVVSHDEFKVRIRTENASKHILLKFIRQTDNEDRYYRNDKDFISCSVIRSEMNESEYSSDREWIKEIPYESNTDVFFNGSSWEEPERIEVPAFSADDVQAFAEALGRMGMGRRRRRRTYSDSD